MGNCATCCGKADTGEVTTGAYNKKGSTKEGMQLVDEIKKNNKTNEITKI